MTTQHCSRTDILEDLARRIAGHASDRAGFGYIGQDPYKSDIFRLFKSALDADMDIAKADALVDALVNRYESLAEEGTSQNEILTKIAVWWQEWRYALIMESELVTR